MSEAEGTNKDKDTNGAELDFELITNFKQLAPPPPLRKEKVVLADVKTVRGKPAGFFCWELSALDYSEFQETTRVYVNGSLDSISLKNEDMKYLAYTVRDANNNRIWNTVEEAIAQLGQFGRSVTNQLVAASNRVNSSNYTSAEGNSEKTQTDS